MGEYGLRYLEDGLVLSGDEAWAWFRQPTHGWDLLSEGQQLAHLAQGERLIGGLRDATGHLLVVPRSLSVKGWADRLREQTRRPTPGWEGYLGKVAEHLQGQSFQGRQVYLGLRIAGRRRGLLELLARRRRPGDPRPTEAEREALRSELDRMRIRVVAGCPGARLATAAELCWLIRRAMTRGEQGGLGDREPAARPAWGDEMRALLEGVIHNGYQSLQLGDAAHMTTLAVAHMPEAFEFPGGSEWLHRIDALPFPVEVSLRFQVIPPYKAAAHAESKATAAIDQIEHIGVTSAPVPLDVQETLDGARRLARDLRRGHYPLVHVWPRLTVAAPSKALMEERALTVIEVCRDLGVELVQPSGDQLALFHEGIPGDRVRVAAYRDTMPPVTLAGSMYAASTEVGDRDGPYFGYTKGTSRRPVLLDPLRAARVDAATVMSLNGSPGSGKTNAASKLVYEASLRGAWSVVLAHKVEDVLGLSRLAGLGASQLVRFDHTYEGVLDPFRIEEDRAEAQLLAVDLCSVFLPPPLARRAEGLLLAAVAAEAEQAGRPSLSGVVGRLERSANDDAREAGAALRAIAGKPLARTCFGEASGPRLRLDGGLTILLLDNMGLPDPSRRPDEWTIPQRLAVGLLRAVTALVGQLLAAVDRHQPKLLLLDEAWALTSSAEGCRLVERIARIGRARNLALLLATQSAADLGDQRIRNNLGVKLGFRSEDEVELRSMLGLLGVEPTPDVLAMVRRFAPGECLMRDLEGRVGRVQVDLVLPELREAFDTTPHALPKWEEEIA